MDTPKANLTTPPAPIPALAGVTRASESAAGREGLIPLDRNERLAPLPAWFVERLREAVQSSLLTTYPALDDLYEAVEAWTGLTRDRLLLVPGSDAAFRSAYQAYVAPGDRVVMVEPSYAMYRVYAGVFGAEPVAIPVERDLLPDPERLVGAITDGVRLVLLASPGQPTGVVLPAEVLDAVLAKAAEVGALVVVDEAYHPFSPETQLDRVNDEPTLLVTRTFSKAAGLAGLRVGLAAGDPQVTGALAKVRSVFDIPSFSAAAVRLVLEHPEVMSDYVAAVDAGREVLADAAHAARLEPLASPTNFMVIRLPEPLAPADLARELRDRGWIVRAPFAAPALADCIRVTLGPPELMTRFADALGPAVEALTRT